MFIANSKRTFGEVRGLNSPAGATMVPAVPLLPLTIRKIPLTRRQSRAGGKCSYGDPVMPLTYGQFARLPPVVLSPICALSAALASLPPRRRSSVDSSDLVLDCGFAPRAA